MASLPIQQNKTKRIVDLTEMLINVRLSHFTLGRRQNYKRYLKYKAHVLEEEQWEERGVVNAGSGSRDSLGLQHARQRGHEGA